MNELLSAISTVGFPISACVALGWFINKTMTTMQDANKARESQLLKIINEQSESLTKIAETLDSICDRLGEVERKVDQSK